MRKFGHITVAATLAGVLCLGGIGVAVSSASMKPAVTCTPGYRPCIPLKRSDVDCAGGSGNGPRYTRPGVVYTVKRGYDRYGLDADRDGKGCE